MSAKGTEILNKLIGAGLMVASVAFFAESGPLVSSILPGLLFGGSGLWLAVRRDRHPVADPDLPQRVTQLAEGLAATQLELSATQERLERLSDEQDFMRQLSTPPARVPREIPPRLPVEMPPRAAGPAAGQADAPDAEGRSPA